MKRGKVAEPIKSVWEMMKASSGADMASAKGNKKMIHERRLVNGNFKITSKNKKSWIIKTHNTYDSVMS